MGYILFVATTNDSVVVESTQLWFPEDTTRKRKRSECTDLEGIVVNASESSLCG